MTRPNPMPSELNYIPANSIAYKVKKADSFFNLVEKPEVKAAGMKPIDLCYFNFKTKNSTEINWYLFNKVGCRNKTYDGMNYTFSDFDQPGIIYLPKPGMPVAAEPEKPLSITKTWLGVCDKYSLHLAVTGFDLFTGWAASMDYNGKGIEISGNIGRFGPGIGGGIGSCIVFITGVSDPKQISGYSHKDWDFNVSLGGAWGKIGKLAANLKKFDPLIKVIKKLGVVTPNMLKNLLVTDPDGYTELYKASTALKDSFGIQSDKPAIYIIDTPIAFGAEASVFYSEIHITNANWLNVF